MAEVEASSIETIVTRASNGDHDAFRHLVNHYQNDIFRLAFLRTLSEMDAQDITQDVFFTAVKKMNKLESPDRFKHWLYRIAINKVKDHMRKKKFVLFFRPFTLDEIPARPDDIPHADDRPVQETRLYKKEFWEKARTLTASLSLMEKEVFLLRFFDQQELTEIAAILNKGESTVKTHLYRALKKIKNSPEKAILLESGRP